MELVNYTPFPGITWTTLTPDGQRLGVLLVRACLRLVPAEEDATWQLQPAEHPGELFAQDAFFGEPGHSSVRHESDFVPFKPRTDRVLNAIAHSPNGQPAPHWQCGVAVHTTSGALQHLKVLRVTGERHWQRGLLGWRLTDPAPCTEVPLRYELAYGGGCRAPAAADGRPGRWLALCEHNPVGRGLLHRDNPARVIPAARIEAPNRPIADPNAAYTPQGFGFIHRAWQPRLAIAGRYDHHWLAEQHPLPPHDVDPAHHNAAHPDLIGAGAPCGYLSGRETLRLAHLLPGAAQQTVALPGYRLLARRRLNHGNAAYQALALDTVLLDLDTPDPADRRAYLSWRLRYPLDPSSHTIEALLVKPRPAEQAHHG